MCNFKVALAGRCKKEGDPFCEEHSKEKCCVCKEQAARGCCYEDVVMRNNFCVEQFVCGQPLCDNCTGVQNYTAKRGLIGHTHVKKEAKTGVVK